MNDMRKYINIVESAQQPETPITEWAPVLMNLAWEIAPNLMMENPMALFQPDAPGDLALKKVKGILGKASNVPSEVAKQMVDQAQHMNIPPDRINRLAADDFQNLDLDSIFNKLSPEQQADLVSKATNKASSAVMSNPGAVWKGLPGGAKAGLIGGGALAAYGLYNALRRRKDD